MVLIGVALIIIGFALRLNSLVVVTVAGLVTGFAIPLLIKQFGANPNQIAAISMFAGYCGTLMTPMAANFNIVPAALLDLKDKNHVIRVQIPTALCALAFNIVLMYFLIK